jgi:hypothetical protein
MNIGDNFKFLIQASRNLKILGMEYGASLSFRLECRGELLASVFINGGTEFQVNQMT